MTSPTDSNYTSSDAIVSSRAWHYRPAVRATDDEPRKPLLPLPENLPARSSDFTRTCADAFWNGTVRWTEDDLLESVAGGQDIILMVALSGLVVADCDVKVRWDPKAGCSSPWVVKKGIEQLEADARACGHSLSEAPTYAVRTKSGGVHLYYQQDSRWPVTETTHHLQDWNIDVIATPHLWVAAPPTPGYQVIRDLDAMVMPEWLSVLLRTAKQRHLPQGGKAMHQNIIRVHDSHQAVMQRRMMEERRGGGGYPAISEMRGLLKEWVGAITERVVLCAHHGGWNQALYQGTCDLVEYGWPWEKIAPVMLDASKNGFGTRWDARVKRHALSAMEGAWKKYHGVKPPHLDSL